ncbi:hypothetical protein [Ekhidna sp.]
MEEFRREIDAILEDHESGSTILLDKIILSLDQRDIPEEELCLAFERLGTIDPAMVIIHHFINEDEARNRTRVFKVFTQV